MGIPTGYSRTTFSGHLPGGEIFNWSLWADEAPSDQAATQAQATAFASAFTADPGVNLPPWKLIGSDAGYDLCTVYSYVTAPLGRATYVAQAPCVEAGSSSASSTLPNQCSVVCSIHTAVAGRRAKGRVYLPITKYALGSGGQLDSSTPGSLAAWMAAFIEACNSHIGSQHIGVLSQVGELFNAATSIVVDSRIDIQRRRANRQSPSTRGTAAIS